MPNCDNALAGLRPLLPNCACNAQKVFSADYAHVLARPSALHVWRRQVSADSSLVTIFLSHAGRTNLAILIELGVGFQEVRVEQRLRVGNVGKADEHEPSSDNVRQQPPF